MNETQNTKTFAERAAFALTLGITSWLESQPHRPGPCTLFLRKPVAMKLKVVVVEFNGRGYTVTKKVVGK
jgi:hypothetical protein